jgi:2-iminobutanoate/2-iminopropanoate deaminase
MTIKQPVSTTNAPAPGGAYSQAIIAGELVSTAGQVGTDPETGALAPDTARQVDQAITNLRTVLEAAGCTLADVVKTTCFLADIGDFGVFDEVYRRRFPEPYPSRSTMGVALAGDLRFEIEAWAVRPEGGR